MLPLRLLASSLLLLSACSSTFAAAPAKKARPGTNDDIITACVAKSTGITRIVAKPGDCIAEFERVVRWNKEGPQGIPGLQGPAGPQGLAGPSGPAGPAGPAGAAGGQTWSANLLLPSSITSATPALFGPALGIGTFIPRSGDTRVELPIPAACRASKFRATAVGARGYSSATVYLAASNRNGSYDLPVYCTLNTANGADASCESPMSSALRADQNVLILIGAFSYPSDFEGASLRVSFVCQ